MDVVVHESVEQIGPDKIEALDGGLDFSYGLIRALEKSLWGHLKVRYLCVEHQGETVAYTPVFIGSNMNFNALQPRLVQNGYNAMIEQLGVAAAYTAVFVGCLISDRGCIPMHPELEERSTVVKSLLQAIEQLVHEEKAQLCIIKDIHGSSPESEKVLMREAGYVQTYSLPTIRVNTDYRSFDEYLKQNMTKNGRKHARKAFRKAEGRIEIKVVRDFADLIPMVYPLFRATFLKAKFKLEELPPAFFVESELSTRPESELVICRRRGEIIGALLSFFSETQQLNKRIGIDYNYPDTGLIYNLLNYQGLIQAIERGIGTVDLGQSTYQAKIRMGGELTDQYLFIKAYSLSLRVSLPGQKFWLTRYSRERVLEGLKQGNLI